MVDLILRSGSVPLPDQYIVYSSTSVKVSSELSSLLYLPSGYPESCTQLVTYPGRIIECFIERKFCFHDSTHGSISTTPIRC